VTISLISADGKEQLLVIFKQFFWM